MTQQIINVGTNPNSNDGDPIRTAFQKTNANFTELYSQIGGGNNFSVVAGSNPPDNPVANELWWNSDNGKLYVRYLNSWVETSSTSTGGYIGSTGYTGSSGLLGYTGSMAYTGSKGDIGYVGSRGVTGSQGTVGAQGYTGYTGSQGIAGYIGSRGYVGSQGHDGIQGITGYTGSQGIGYTGSQGVFGDININETPPTVGNLWWDPKSGNLYIKYETQWVPAITINPNLAFTPTNLNNWTSPVHNLFDALNQIAARLYALEHQ
jgi:hypothetical protein